MNICPLFLANKIYLYPEGRLKTLEEQVLSAVFPALGILCDVSNYDMTSKLFSFMF